MLGQTTEMIRHRFAGAGEDERGASAYGTEVDLQAAVTANVVERAPDGRAIRGTRGAHGRGETGEVMHHHLRYAGRAGRHQHPFRARARQWPFRRHFDRRRTENANRKIESCVRRRSFIDDHSVDTRRRHDRAEMAGLGIGRQDHEAATYSVELDERCRRRQLISGRDENRAARQFREPATETGGTSEGRTVFKIGKANGLGAIPKKPRRRRLCDRVAQRRRVNACHAHRLSRNRRASPERTRPRRP